MNEMNTPTATDLADTALRMMSDRVLVIPSNEDGERATRGGLVIPATANDDRRLRWGEVALVGPSTSHVKPGDRILYAPDSGYEAEIQGVDYVILRAREVQAVAISGATSEPGLYL